MYKETLTAWSIAMSKHSEAEEGDKIILPQNALFKNQPSPNGSPLCFKISNPESQISLHTGVLEFSALTGSCYIPHWVMNQLCIDEGKSIQVESVVDIPKATSIKLRLNGNTVLTNPRALLEVKLRKFTCLTQGSWFCVSHLENLLYFDIIETRPDLVVCVVDTDCNLEFDAEPPRRESFHRRSDAVDLQQPLDLSEVNETTLSENNMLTRKKDLKPLKKFPGMGTRLGKK